MSFKISAQGSLCRGALQCGGISVISKQLDAVAFVKRCLRRQRSGALVLVSEFARFDLAGFDVGLIERIDANERTCHRGREFPAKEFLPEVVNIRHGTTTYRIPSLFH